MKKAYIAIAAVGILILIICSELAAVLGAITIIFLIPAALTSIAAFITSSISDNTCNESKEKNL